MKLLSVEDTKEMFGTVIMTESYCNEFQIHVEKLTPNLRQFKVFYVAFQMAHSTDWRAKKEPRH